MFSHFHNPLIVFKRLAKYVYYMYENNLKITNVTFQIPIKVLDQMAI